MDGEKHTSDRRTMNRGYHSRSSRIARALVAVMACLLIVYCSCYQWLAVPVAVAPSAADALLVPRGEELQQQQGQQPLAVGGEVPLEAHIVSKCPDTKDALRKLILPAMQRVSDKVDFKLSYIGKPSGDGGVECMHGPSECMGNIIELCARELYPDLKTSLGFIMCLTRDYKNIPERSLVEDCALEHAIDFEALNECATRDDGEHGMQMLRSSIQRTAEANVTKSCTIRLNEEIYCIRDGGEWKDCPNGGGVNDLIIAIEKLYRSS